MNSTQLLEELYDSYRSCTDCDLCKLRKNSIIRGTGNANADIVFVLDKIPFLDKWRRTLFVASEEGLILRGLTEKLGVDYQEFWYTPTTLCPTKETSDPKIGQLKACKTRLLTEISIIRPKLVLACGTAAINILLSHEKAKLKYHGGVIFQMRVPGELADIEMPVMVMPSLTTLMKEPSVGSDSAWEQFYLFLGTAVDLVNKFNKISGESNGSK
jgi:uracil-DNA glycosylase family 4